MGKRFIYKDSRQNYPGPGNYIRFSEFGILVPKRQKNQGETLTEGNAAGQDNAKEKENNVKETSAEPENNTKEIQAVPEKAEP